MKSVLMGLLLAVCLPVYAGCESSVIEGGHTAFKLQDAKAGAWEDAADACPGGQVTSISLDCVKVDGDIGVMGKAAIRCFQEAYCNVCGDDLVRKYEAQP